MADVPTNVANLLSRLSNVKDSPDGWVATCPNPGHSGGKGDSRPSLRVAVGELGRPLVICRSGCSTDDVLTAMGLGWKDLCPNGDGGEYQKVVRQSRTLSNEEIVRRNRSYKAILNALPLEEIHREHLQKERGFSPELIERAQYRSIRNHTFVEACRKTRSTFDAIEYEGDVPGLREAGRNLLYSGIVLPVRDPDGRIVALKVRRFGNGPKYVYLSDVEAPSGAHPHWPLGEAPSWGRQALLRITEGELKADLATALSGIYTVSIPGVTNWAPLIEQLRPRVQKATEPGVVVAFDWPDVQAKPGIRDQLRRLLRALADLGFQVGVEHWIQEFKGIDDLLAAGHTPDYTAGLEECLALLDSLGEETPNVGAVCVAVHEDTPGDAPEDPCEFPVNVYPPGVREFVLNVAERTDAPLDFAGVAALVVSAAAIGATRRVKIIPGWTEAACFYAAIIAPPGSGKSPAIGRVQRPIILRQKEAVSRYKREYKAWIDAGNTKAPKPVLMEYYSTDITVAGVTDRLGKNPRGILLSPDEIMAWVRSFGQVGMGNDQDVYLSLWTGQPIKVDRKTGDTPVIWVDYPYISALGSVQPKRLPELSSGGRGDDGFLDRFLFSFPEVRDPAPWEEKDFQGTGTDDSLADIWEGAICRLYQVPFETGREGNSVPGLLQLSPEGWSQACRWYNETIHVDLKDPNFPEYLKGFWLKLKAYYFRFALTLEMLWWSVSQGVEPPQEISRRSLAAAGMLCEYFKCHARRVAGHSSPSEEVQQIEELLRWALRGKKGGVVTARDVVRSNNPILPRKMVDARNLLVTAQQHNAGTFHPEWNGSKDVFVVQPREKK